MKRIQTSLAFLFSLTFYFLLSNSSSAQVVWGGHAKGSIYGFGEKYDFTSAFAELRMSPEYRGGKVYVNSDIRFRSGIQFNHPQNQIQIKEAYAAYQGEKLDFSLGNQIVQWGRTDGFNPTNHLASNDYFLFSGDPDDQLLGTFMLKLNYRLSPVVEIEGIVIPIYNPSIYRYELFDFGERAQFGDPLLPERSMEHASLAARINFNLPAAGFSISGFRGYDPFYGFSIQSVDWSSGSPMIRYAAKPYFKNSLGADFAFPLGSLILRGEIAWNRTKNDMADFSVPNSNLNYVAGFEASLAGITAIIQYLGKYDLDYQELETPVLLDPTDPMAVLAYTNASISYESAKYNRNIFNMTQEINHGVLISLNKSFSYDLINLELTGYYLITTDEYLVRPKISFRLSDGLNLAIGGQYMAGVEGSVFDTAGTVMNGAFLELKASF